MRRFVPLALLLCVLVFALAAAGCGGEETVTPTPDTVVGSVAEQTVPQGDAEAGKSVFVDTGCGSCHTFEAAGTSGTTGPNLDESLQGKDEQYIFNAIVNPDAQIAEGFQPGLMPKTYGEQLDDKQLGDLVAFLKPQS
jgi:mono/diheme cytochrome c family protein